MGYYYSGEAVAEIITLLFSSFPDELVKEIEEDQKLLHEL